MASKGIVVEHKGNGIRYALSEINFNPKIHTKIRDLKPGESVLTYTPRRKQALAVMAEANTEGSTVDTKDENKEGN